MIATATGVTTIGATTVATGIGAVTAGVAIVTVATMGEVVAAIDSDWAKSL